MDTKDIATAALQLLERVDLKGSEVGVFLEVNKLPGELANEKTTVVNSADVTFPGSSRRGLLEEPSQRDVDEPHQEYRELAAAAGSAAGPAATAKG